MCRLANAPVHSRGEVRCWRTALSTLCILARCKTRVPRAVWPPFDFCAAVWRGVWSSVRAYLMHSFVCCGGQDSSKPTIIYSPRWLLVQKAAMPFQIPTPLTNQASAEKRSAEGASPQQAKKAKLPPLSDLVAMESAPKRQSAQRLPVVGPLNIVIFKARPLSRFHCVLASCHL